MSDTGVEGPVSAPGPSKLRLALAFAAIYLIWGSSYVAIHFAIETLPIFLMAGVRFIAAGLLLYGWSIWHGAPAPTRKQWRSAAIAGFFLFLLNNGALVISQQVVPPGMMSLLLAGTPLWMIMIHWLFAGGMRPRLTVFAGLALGLFGIALLVSPSSLTAGTSDSNGFLLGAVLAVFGSITWSIGSLYGKRADLPSSPMLSTSMQLLTGGVMLLALGLVTGQGAELNLSAVSWHSWLALIYLILGPSIFGFGSFIWLMRVASPTRVSTYAYVNPVVALFLGWLLAHETITERTIIAAAIIIASVMMMNGIQLPQITAWVRGLHVPRLHPVQR